jgi:hypothetical protein
MYNFCGSGFSIKVDCLLEDLPEIIENMIEKLETDAINALNFRLNKYTLDGKTPYQKSHTNMVKGVRSGKAEVLLKIRKLKSQLKELEK